MGLFGGSAQIFTFFEESIDNAEDPVSIKQDDPF